MAGLSSLRIFCINLKSREDRWAEFTAQPAVKELQARCKFQRFEAVVGKELDIANETRISVRAKRNILQKTRRDHEDLNTVGGAGCYLSQTAIWKQIAEGSEPYAIIFEDDMKLPDDFLARFEKLLPEFEALEPRPAMWTFNYPWPFYYRVRGRPLPQRVPANFRGDWLMNTTPGGTGAYLLTKEGAVALLQGAFPMDMHIDLYVAANTEIGKAQVVMNRQLIVRYLSNFVSSDINPYQLCPVCDIPSDFQNSFFDHKTIALIGVIALLGASTAYLALRGGRRRR